MNKKNFWIGAVIVIIIIILLAKGSSNSAATGPIKIGVINPLSGPAGNMGEEIMNTLKLASTSSATLAYEDDQCDAKKAISAYQKLKLDGVHVFIVSCSGSVLALAPLAKQDGNLILTAYAGSSEIRKTGDEVIRLIPDALSIAGEMGDYIISLRDLKKLGLLYENQDYAKSVATVLRQKIEPFNPVEEVYSAEDTSFRTQITKLKASGVDVLLYVPTSDKAAKLIYSEMKTLNYKPTIIGDVNVCEYPFSPKDFGMRAFCFDAGFTTETEAYKQFVVKYKEVYGKDSTAPFYDAITYDIAQLVDKFAKSNKSADFVPALKKYFLGGVDGQMSHYTFSADGKVMENGYLKRFEK